MAAGRTATPLESLVGAVYSWIFADTGRNPSSQSSPVAGTRSAANQAQPSGPPGTLLSASVPSPAAVTPAVPGDFSDTVRSSGSSVDMGGWMAKFGWPPTKDQLIWIVPAALAFFILVAIVLRRRALWAARARATAPYGRPGQSGARDLHDRGDDYGRRRRMDSSEDARYHDDRSARRHPEETDEPRGYPVGSRDRAKTTGPMDPRDPRYEGEDARDLGSLSARSTTERQQRERNERYDRDGRSSRKDDLSDKDVRESAWEEKRQHSRLGEPRSRGSRDPADDTTWDRERTPHHEPRDMEPPESQQPRLGKGMREAADARSRGTTLPPHGSAPSAFMGTVHWSAGRIPGVSSVHLLCAMYSEVFELEPGPRSSLEVNDSRIARGTHFESRTVRILNVSQVSHTVRALCLEMQLSGGLSPTMDPDAQRGSAPSGPVSRGSSPRRLVASVSELTLSPGQGAEWTWLGYVWFRSRWPVAEAPSI